MECETEGDVLLTGLEENQIIHFSMCMLPQTRQEKKKSTKHSKKQHSALLPTDPHITEMILWFGVHMMKHKRIKVDLSI